MHQEHDKILLLEKPKKGILRLIFSRTALIFVLFFLQISILLSTYHWFADYFGWFRGVQSVFSIGMLLYLFNSEMDATGKLTWLFLIMLFPVPSTVLLFFTKLDLGHRTLKKIIELRIEESRGLIIQDEEIIQAEEIVNSATDDLNRYINRSGSFPIYQNTKVTYFPSGEAQQEALLQHLRQAEKFIYLEYFIIGEGEMWGSILRILAEKASEGVDVRVIYDGMCEISTLSADYKNRLQELGIQCKAFAPIAPFLSTYYNYRDHRKILVIDGQTAFNGGVNLADEYINRKERFGYWKDASVMLEGEAAQSFTLMFLQMWNLDEREPVWDSCQIREKVPESSGYVMPYCDCPLDDDRVGEMVYIDILNRARTYVHIMTPYLILDDELERALTFAAQRGVDVRIILPGIPDKKIPYALAKSHYRTLTRAGVKIYEYTPGFVHAKVFLSDDEKAVVGTINLDYRSLYHHFECATYLYKTDCISQIEKDFADTLAECRPITEETIKKEKLFYKIVGKVVKIFAPLL